MGCSAENKGDCPPPMLKALEALGIAADSTLIRFDNNIDFYLRILQSFVSNAPANIKIARSFPKQPSAEDIETYRIAAHTVKGSSKGIGNEKLGDMAEKLEYAAKRGDTVFIEAHNDLFIKEAEQFIASVSAMLQTMPEGEHTGKIEKEAPDPLLLTALKRAAENYDMAGIQEAFKSLDAYYYAAQPDLVKHLREKADKSDFAGLLAFCDIQMPKS